MMGDPGQFKPSPREVDQLSTVLASLSPTLDDALLYDPLRDRYEMSKFKSSAGSTNGTTSHFLVDDDAEAIEHSTDDDLLVNIKDMLDYLYAKTTKSNIYLDDIMFTAAHASRPTGIETYHLSKIWIIYLDSAKRTLEVRSWHSTMSDNPTLSRKYGTNDLVLQYKRIK